MNDKPTLPDAETSAADPLNNGVPKEEPTAPANPPLPVAMRNEEISPEDFEALCRIAANPETLAGRLQRVPRKISRGDRPADNEVS